MTRVAAEDVVGTVNLKIKTVYISIIYGRAYSIRNPQKYDTVTVTVTLVKVKRDIHTILILNLEGFVRQLYSWHLGLYNRSG